MPERGYKGERVVWFYSKTIVAKSSEAVRGIIF